MRQLLVTAALLILASAAVAEIQTLADIGISGTVEQFEESHTWKIPYEFGGNCTPFIQVNLISGRLQIREGNRKILDVKKPGRYRAIIDREGVLDVTLERLPGDATAKIDTNSFIACDKIPVVRIRRKAPEIWRVGGYTPVRIYLSNEGSADADGIIILRDPWNAAPLNPPGRIKIPAGNGREMEITMLTAKENNKVLFPETCLEYQDKYGRTMVCTDSSTFKASKHVPLACIDENNEIEVMNIGYVDTEVQGNLLHPRESKFMGEYGILGANTCEIRLKLTKMDFSEKEDVGVYYATILTLLGILGLLLSEKRLKTSKA